MLALIHVAAIEDADCVTVRQELDFVPRKGLEMRIPHKKGKRRYIIGSVESVLFDTTKKTLTIDLEFFHRE